MCTAPDTIISSCKQQGMPVRTGNLLAAHFWEATACSITNSEHVNHHSSHHLLSYPHPATFCCWLVCYAGSCQMPVLHGDCVFDAQLGVTILSGDTIMRGLAQALQPRYCVFLTDVAGLYSKPPEQPGAQLIAAVQVAPDGSWSVAAAAAAAPASPPGAGGAAAEGAEPRGGGSAAAGSSSSTGTGGMAVQLTAAAHDTTGGIATKVAEAAGVVLAGCPVVIAQAGTASGAAAVLHGPDAFAAGGTGASRFRADGGEQLQGTVIKPAAAAAADVIDEARR
jgi:hypothetical protein